MARSRTTTVRIVLLLVLLGAGLVLGQNINEMARTASAYGAKIYGSNVLLAGREVASVRADEFAPETTLDRIMGPLISVEVDREKGILKSRVLGHETIAVYRPGLGVTLAPEGKVQVLLDQSKGLPKLDPARRKRPWPLGDADATAELPGPLRTAMEAALDAAFAERAEGPKLRTRAVVVIHRGKIVAERYAEGFDQDSLLLGWSMAKSVTNALAAIAVRDGLIDLDQGRVLKAWSSADDPRAKITWRHLLSMTPSLEWDETYSDVAADPAQMLFLQPAAGRFAAARSLIAKPGARGYYSSGTTNIICEALRERIPDLHTWLNWPRQKLFKPAGLDSMVLEPDPSGTFVGSSFAWATARDWARFGLLFLNDGRVGDQRLLPEGWVAATTTPVRAWKVPRYGLHFWLNRPVPEANYAGRMPNLPPDLYQASGFQRQKVTMIPSREAVIVRLGLTKQRSRFDEAGLIDAILKALPGAR